jgi:DNA-binding transcriptional regulator GbsR (MarR family)
MTDSKEIKKSIYSSFAEIASSIGYSDIHGRIIGALLVNNKKLSMQDLAEETGYSLSTISLSLDFLEVMGMIKKIKNAGDRKLYIELQGDLLEGLKRAFVLNLQKNIGSTLGSFESYKDELSKTKGEESKKVMKVLNTLEGEIKRLNNYVNLLSKLKLP